jgi:hypothetical protein
MALLELYYWFQFPHTRNLGVWHIWDQGKQFGMLVVQVDNSIHQNKPTPYCPKSVPLWTFEQFATTPSTWDFYLIRFSFALWISYCPTITLEILIGTFHIGYDTLLFQIGLFHFGIISLVIHSKSAWRRIKSLWVFQLNWLSSAYSCYRFSIFLAACSASFNLMDRFSFSCWTLFNCPLTMTNFLSRFFKVLCSVSSFRL